MPPPPFSPAHGPLLRLPQDLPVAGSPFVVQAVDAHGNPVGGAQLVVRDLAAQTLATPVTGADGNAAIMLGEPGPYLLHWATAEGVEVVVPFHVVAPRAPLGLALWTVPLALVLGWIALRRFAPRAS